MADVFGISVDEEVTTQNCLRKYRNPPSRFVANKVIGHVDDLARRFIAASPMVVLATRRKDGGVDMTPRGDPPGFVQVLNDRVIAVPDRLGNNRADAFENILLDPGIGLYFIIPGHNDSLRISGQAQIVRDTKLMTRMDVRGHVPDLAILVRVDALLSHCPKAFVRSGMWERDGWPDLGNVPSAGEFLKAHGNLPDPLSDVEGIVEKDGRTRLY
ncbi:MAG: pyridoxamine 5'-phosphate oxidase family protein [Hoeflea sp.]|uniref:MSMEG_1061 family FMN-dependent PPOX-type flavoprotein n=1 Tax=Hoeflea sp. TaxID=1940281 RepID=UPI0032EB0213